MRSFWILAYVTHYPKGWLFPFSSLGYIRSVLDKSIGGVILVLKNSQNSILVGGIPTPLKNMKVSWDDDIPNIWKVIKAMFQTTNQYLLSWIWEPDDKPLDLGPMFKQSHGSTNCRFQPWNLCQFWIIPGENLMKRGRIDYPDYYPHQPKPKSSRRIGWRHLRNSRPKSQSPFFFAHDIFASAVNQMFLKRNFQLLLRSRSLLKKKTFLANRNLEGGVTWCYLHLPVSSHFEAAGSTAHISVVGADP